MKRNICVWLGPFVKQRDPWMLLARRMHSRSRTSPALFLFYFSSHLSHYQRNDGFGVMPDSEINVWMGR